MATELQCTCACGSGLPAFRRRQNTAYNDEESNYATLCWDCQQRADDYWNERWAEYHSDIRASLVEACCKSKYGYRVIIG